MDSFPASDTSIDVSSVALLRLGKFDEAQLVAEQTLARLRDNRTNPEFFTSCFVLTEIMRHRGRYEEALRYLESLDEPHADDIESQIGLLMHRGYNYAWLGKYNFAHRFLEKAETLALESDRFEYHGEARLRRAMLAYLEERFAEAESLYKSVVDGYGKRFGWYLYSVATTGVGKALMAQQRFNEAIPWLDTAAVVIASEGADFQFALNRGEIAMCYLGLDEADRALELLHACSAIYIPLGAIHSYQVNLADIGNIYFHRRDYLTAISYYQTAFQIAHEIKAAASVEKWAYNIRLAYAKLRDSEAAIV